jgi:hypothetical protein
MTVATLILSFLGFASTETINEVLDLPVVMGYRFTKTESDQKRKIEELDKVMEQREYQRITLYRVYLDDKGSEAYAALGREDFNKLKDLPLDGMYYSSAKLGKDLEARIQKLGVDIVGHAIPFWHAPIDFWFGEMYSKVACSMVTAFALVLLAIDQFYRRDKVIARFNGVLRKATLYRQLQMLGTAALTGFLLFGISQVLRGTVNVSNPFSIAFGSILATNFLILTAVVLAVETIDSLLICLGSIRAILNGESVDIFHIPIWVGMILICALMLPGLMNDLTDSKHHYFQQIKLLDNWAGTRDFSSLIIEFPSWRTDMRGGEIDTSDDHRFGVDFFSRFTDEDMIFVKRSNAHIQAFLPDEEKKSMITTLRSDGVDLDVARQVLYVNQNALRHEGLSFPTTNVDKLVSIYAPDKFEKRKADILRLVTLEYSNSNPLATEEVDFHVYHSKEEAFLFDRNSLDNASPIQLEEQTLKSPIFVVINTEMMLARTNADAFMSDLADGLFRTIKLTPARLTEEQLQNMHDVEQPYKQAKLQILQLKRRLTKETCALVALVAFQLLIVYRFIFAMADRQLKKWSIARLMGHSMIWFGIKVFGLPVVLVTASAALSYGMTNNHLLGLLFVVAVLSMTMLICLVVFWFLKQKSLEVLKGALS